MRPSSLAVLLSLGVLVAGCDPGVPEPTGTRSDSAGVEVVTSAGPGQPRHFDLTTDGALVATMIPSDDEGRFHQALRRMGESDTTAIADLTFPRPGMVRYPSCGGGLNLPRIFEVQLGWAASGRTVVVSRTPTYEIEVYEGDRLTRMIRRELPPREATGELAREELGEGFAINFGQGACTIPPREMVAARGFAEAVPWIAGLTLAPTGELWVSRKEVGVDRQGPTDVFDAGGRYVGTLPSTAPFPVLFLGEDRVVAIESDDFDVRRLVVYDVARGR